MSQFFPAVVISEWGENVKNCNDMQYILRVVHIYTLKSGIRFSRTPDAAIQKLWQMFTSWAGSETTLQLNLWYPHTWTSDNNVLRNKRYFTFYGSLTCIMFHENGKSTKTRFLVLTHFKIGKRKHSIQSNIHTFDHHKHSKGRPLTQYKVSWT